MKAKFTLFLACLLGAIGVSVAGAQEKKEEKSFKVSGYVQAQYQYGQQDAALKVGTGNENPDEGFNRIGIRRGRIKFTFEEDIFSAVFQVDITEKGVGFKDAYLNLKDPWGGSNALRAGIFDRPFGYEISYSSSRRESPERSTVFQTLFPDERDLGAMLVLQPSKKSKWNFLKLEAGLFAGNGIKQETDNKKDFIGHLSLSKAFGPQKKVALGGGFSYYNGSVYRGTPNIYRLDDNGAFVLSSDQSFVGKFAKREYFGIDLQFSADWALGRTAINGEYLWGQQPGTAGSSKSPNASTLPTGDTYIRDFSGWYVMLVQSFGKLPLSAVVKYDVYDPNSKVSKDQIGQGGTGKTDARQSALGFGLLWDATKNFRLTGYYELVNYEKSAHLAALDQIKANAFTLRLQYKF